MYLKAQNLLSLISLLFIFLAASCPQNQAADQEAEPDVSMVVDSALKPMELTDVPEPTHGDSLTQLQSNVAEKKNSHEKFEVHQPMPENRLPKDKERLEKERKKREKEGGN